MSFSSLLYIYANLRGTRAITEVRVYSIHAMTQKITISGGGPYGFKIRGGIDINQGIFVSSVSAYSKAELGNVQKRYKKEGENDGNNFNNLFCNF